MNGLTLSRLFYENAARPIIERVVNPEEYSAALIGWSSEVLGFDDTYSGDHNWGPRFILFLDPKVHESRAESIDRRLREQLPPTFMGYPTNFGPTALGDQRVMKHREQGLVNHFVQIERLDCYLQRFVGIDDAVELTVGKWLEMSEHNLLAL